MKRMTVPVEVYKEIICSLDLQSVTVSLENEAIKRRQDGTARDYLVPVGKFIILPESLLKYSDETIIGVCLDYLNKKYSESQVSIFKKQKSKRHRVAFANCAMISIMIVVEA